MTREPGSSSTTWVILSLAIGVASSGCVAHVHLDPAPSPDASRKARVAYYERHAPEYRIIDVDAVTMQRMPQRATRLRLASGVLVREPEDLIPAVGERSATAGAAREAIEARADAKPWLMVAGGATAGAVVAGVFTPVVGVPALAISGGLLAASLVPYIVAGRHLFRARDADERAFSSYHQDLLIRLDLRMNADGILFDDPEVPPQWRKRQPRPPKPLETAAPP